MKLNVKVIPNSSRSKVEKGDKKDFFKIYLKSAPKKGKANEELIQLLSKYFNVKKGNVRIVKGKTSKLKEIEINEK